MDRLEIVKDEIRRRLESVDDRELLRHVLTLLDRQEAEEIPPHVLKRIEEGENDFREGRYMTLDEARTWFDEKFKNLS